MANNDKNQDNSDFAIFHQRMKNIAESLSLPLTYKEDLDGDLLILNRYGKTRYIWGLRQSGVALFPLNKGVEIGYFENYAKTSDELFLLDLQKQEITRVSPEKAIKLGSETPLGDQVWSTDLDVFETQINDVLEFRHWGVFYPPEMVTLHWMPWLDYFRSRQNSLMTKFMNKAISHRDSIIKQSKAA